MNESATMLLSILHEPKLLNFIMNEIDDLLLIIEADGKKIYCSPSYEKKYGTFYAGTNFFEDICQHDRDNIREAVRTVVQTGEAKKLSYRQVAETAQVWHLESKVSVLQSRNEHPEQLLIVTRDVTAQKESAYQQRLLAYALTCTRDCFCLANLEDEILFVNRATCEIYGYAEEELIGKHVGIFRSPNNSPQLLQSILPESTKGSWHGELLNRRKDGSEFPVELWTSVVRNDAEEPIAIVGIARDISERKHTEEILRRNENKFRSLIENSSDGIAMLSKDGKTMYVSSSTTQILGYDAETLMAKPFQEFVHPDDLPLVNAKFLQLLETPNMPIVTHNRVRHLNGTWRWIESTSTNLLDDPNVNAIVANFRDITERKVAETGSQSNLALFHSLVENLQSGILVETDDRKVFVTNKTLCEIFEQPLSANTLIGMNSAEAAEQSKQLLANPDEFTRRIEELVQNRRMVLAEEIRFKNRQIYARDYVPIYSENNEFIGHLWKYRNITHQRRSEKIQMALYRIAQAADQSPSLEALYRSVHDIIASIMPAANFYIALYNEKEDMIAFPYFVDEVDPPMPPKKRGKGLTELVLQTGRPLLCTMTQHEELERRGELELIGSPSPIWLGVPLVVEKKSIGVMAVQHYADVDAYGVEEQDMLEFVSSQVAKAIERKQVEEALREGEERYRIVAETATDAIVTIDQTSTILFVNSATSKVFGYSVDEMFGKQITMLMPEYLRHVHEQAVQRYVQTGQKHISWNGVELPGIHKNGKMISLEVSFGEFRKEGKHLFTGVIRDITERKRADAERQVVYEIIQAVNSTGDLDALLHAIHESLKKIIYAENCFIVLYDKATEMFSEVFFVDLADPPFEPYRLGKSCTAYVFRKGKPVLLTQEMFDRLLQAGEVELVGSNSPSWLGVPLKTSTETIGVLVVQHYEDPNVYSARDVEFLESVGYQVALAIERKRIDEVLRTSEERYRTLFEESQDGIFLSTPEGQLLDVNPAGVDLFGYSSKEEMLKADIGRDLYFNSEDRETFKHNLARQGFVLDFEFTIKCKNGEKRTVLESASALRDDHGNIKAYRGFIRDITERKKLEDQFRQSQKMEGIGTLAGGIAHDFNNILGIILGYTTLIESGSLDTQKQGQSIDTIKKAVERGAGLVRQLLTFARKADPSFESVNINDTVVELAKMLRQTFPRTINILTDIQNDMPSIVADTTQLHQALLNLCVNARDAMIEESGPSGVGTLTLRTGIISGSVLREKYTNAGADEYEFVHVQDTGVGMDESTRQRVFEPFFTTKELGKGTGLGLAVVYGVVNSHHGFVNVETEVGKGTSFTLYFPVQLRKIIKASIAPKVEHHMRGGNETLLLVEDEEMLRELLKTLLEEQGYHVLTAVDGQEGLEIFRANEDRIALVLSDMGLPRLGGWEMFQKMREANPSVRAILASGYFDPNLKLDMLKAGAKDFVQKPYVSEEILKRVREVIDQPS